jgi:microcystin degradation protein MlrC
MKILIARFNHETNTFSPVPTPLAAFEPQYGEGAYRANKGMRTPMAAFIDWAEQRQATLVTPVSAMANPSGRVDADAYDALTGRIVAAAAGCDAMLLDLHGAMVATHTPDGEGSLLARLRAAAPGIPLGVALDLHGNITPDMVENADIMVGFKTYPHVDMYETGAHVARLLGDMLDGRKRYTVRWRALPLMSHTLCSTTAGGAMRDAVALAQTHEQDGLPAASVFAGFSLADIEAPCVSVVVTAEASAAGVQLADQKAGELRDAIWSARAGFVYQPEPLQVSLERASQAAEKARRPVLLLDHGDNCMSGGTCDTMHLLQAALSAGLTDILVGPLCDPAAVETLIRAGTHQTTTLEIGNKVPLGLPAGNQAPMRLTGQVIAVSDGEYTVTGPIYTGMRCNMGRTVLFDTGAARIVLTERPHEPWDEGVFSCVGADPRDCRYLMLKSRMYCRPVFGPLTETIVECNSEGVTSSDYSLFAFQNLRHPLYPIEVAGLS